MAEEGQSHCLQGSRREGGGGGALAIYIHCIHLFVFSSRGRVRGRRRRGASYGFLYLDRAWPPRLTWAALKPSGLPLGSS